MWHGLTATLRGFVQPRFFLSRLVEPNINILCVQFGEGFATFLFKFYFESGQRAKLMALPLHLQPALKEFLAVCWPLLA
jgi:hypothetical protein